MLRLINRQPCFAVFAALALACPSAYSYYFLGKQENLNWQYDMEKQVYQDDLTTLNDQTVTSTKRAPVYMWSRSRLSAKNLNVNASGSAYGAIVGLEDGSFYPQGAYAINLGADEGTMSKLNVTGNSKYGIYLSCAGHTTLESLVSNTQIDGNGYNFVGMHIAGVNGASSRTPNKIHVDNVVVNLNNTTAGSTAGVGLRVYNGGVITSEKSDGTILRGVTVNMGSVGNNGTALSALEGGTFNLHNSTINAGELSSTAVILMESEKGGANNVSLTNSKIVSKEGNTLINSNKAAAGTTGSVSTVKFHNVDLSEARNQKIVVGSNSVAEMTFSGTTEYHGWTEVDTTASLNLILDSGSWWIAQQSFMGNNGALKTLNGGLLVFSYSGGTDTFSLIETGDVNLAAGTNLMLEVASTYFSGATAENPIGAELFRFTNGESITGGDDVVLLTNDNVELEYYRVEGTYYVTGVKSSPIPEPATWSLGLLGLGACMLRRKR